MVGCGGVEAVRERPVTGEMREKKVQGYSMTNAIENVVSSPVSFSQGRL